MTANSDVRLAKYYNELDALNEHVIALQNNAWQLRGLCQCLKAQGYSCREQFNELRRLQADILRYTRKVEIVQERIRKLTGGNYV